MISADLGDFPEERWNESPLFPVEAPDGIRDWAEADRQAVFRGKLNMEAPDLHVFANANAGKRRRDQAVKEGIVAGVFDMTITNGERGERFVAWVEFKGYDKSGRAGKLSQAQIDWGNARTRAGHRVACFFSPDAAVEWIRSLVPSSFASTAPKPAGDIAPGGTDARASLSGHLSDLRSLPDHLAALQLLVTRCPSAELKKELIVMAGCCGAINGDEGHLLVTANQVETA